jgi:hypothetical protein
VVGAEGAGVAGPLDDSVQVDGGQERRRGCRVLVVGSGRLGVVDVGLGFGVVVLGGGGYIVPADYASSWKETVDGKNKTCKGFSFKPFRIVGAQQQKDGKMKEIPRGLAAGAELK